MQGMRDLLRASLARSLQTLSEEDRLAAALPVVCGTALASHCEVASLDENRTLHLRVSGSDWFTLVLGMREVLQHDLQRVAGVRLGGLHFQRAGYAPEKPGASPGEHPPAAAKRPPSGRRNTKKF